jgi:release factor glutamine methyltransferase
MRKAFFRELELVVLDTVYEPKSDSFLLAGRVRVEPGSTVLDLGCGAGLVSVVAAQQGARVLAVDVNPAALENAKANAAKYGLGIATRRSDMFSKVPEKFDYIFFNPPYLPHEDVDDELRAEVGAEVSSWDGGPQGRLYIDAFLREFQKHLNPGGRAFLLNSSKNDITKTKRKLKSLGVAWKVCAKEELFFETLYIFKISQA